MFESGPRVVWCTNGAVVRLGPDFSTMREKAGNLIPPVTVKDVVGTRKSIAMVDATVGLRG